MVWVLEVKRSMRKWSRFQGYIFTPPKLYKRIMHRWVGLFRVVLSSATLRNPLLLVLCGEWDNLSSNAFTRTLLFQHQGSTIEQSSVTVLEGAQNVALQGDTEKELLLHFLKVAESHLVTNKPLILICLEEGEAVAVVSTLREVFTHCGQSQMAALTGSA